MLMTMIKMIMIMMMMKMIKMMIMMIMTMMMMMIMVVDIDNDVGDNDDDDDDANDADDYDNDDIRAGGGGGDDDNYDDDVNVISMVITATVITMQARPFLNKALHNRQAELHRTRKSSLGEEAAESPSLLDWHCPTPPPVRGSVSALSGCFYVCLYVCLSFGISGRLWIVGERKLCKALSYVGAIDRAVLWELCPIILCNTFTRDASRFSDVG